MPEALSRVGMALQNGVAKVRASKVGIDETGPAQICPLKVRAEKTGTVQNSI
jgi:hypothetical protein